MNDRLDDLRALIAKGKYKKALPLLKKFNQKSQQLSYESLEMEAGCLFFEGQYRLSRIKTQQALRLATLPEQKIACLGNMAKASEKAGDKKDALQCLCELVKQDPGGQYLEPRLVALQLAYQLQDWEIIQQIGPSLVKFTAFATPSLLIMAQAAISQGESTLALKHLDTITRQIRMNEQHIIKPDEVISLFACYKALSAYTAMEELLEKLKPAFEQSDWFRQLVHGLSSESTGVSSSSATTAGKIGNGQPPIIRGNNAGAIKALTSLSRTMLQLGARFHSALVFEVDGDDICVKLSQSEAIGGTGMDIPLKCLPVLSDYRFYLSSEYNLNFAVSKHPLNEAAKPILQDLVELYNACNKLASWRKSYPLFSLTGIRPVFDKLLQARCDAEYYQACYADSADAIDEQVLISSFFNSRILQLDSGLIQDLGGKPRHSTELVFIPMIELINHKMGAPGFLLDRSRLCIQTKYESGAEGDELFVQYNLDDPVVTLLRYGFFDASVSWIYTVPLVLNTTTGLTLVVHNQVKQAGSNVVPEHLRDIPEHYPAILVREGSDVYLSKLVIPGKSQINALPRVIAEVLKSVDVEHNFQNTDILNAEVEHLMSQLLDANQQYWQDLDVCIKQQQTSSNRIPEATFEILSKLCEFCSDHLASYVANSGYAR
ncbi:hypothetical protein KJY73_15030 [Bowmanella sp. Y26]|uniref:hypothetical protein n=1 Tax=Bowmanella yangjiangensis TaxID=2811230 RepID=UPI001BDD9B80|nr:hypothetical protein [Bowmanella yangjiangensis]MBT1064905.1 hypothetical protein [Bowmanella yangjiangensis]